MTKLIAAAGLGVLVTLIFDWVFRPRLETRKARIARLVEGRYEIARLVRVIYGSAGVLAEPEELPYTASPKGREVSANRREKARTRIAEAADEIYDLLIGGATHMHVRYGRLVGTLIQLAEVLPVYESEAEGARRLHRLAEPMVEAFEYGTPWMIRASELFSGRNASRWSFRAAKGREQPPGLLRRRDGVGLVHHRVAVRADEPAALMR